MQKFLLDKKFQLIIIVFVTFLAYFNILRNQFVIDDKAFIVDWQSKNSFSNIPKFLAGDVPPGHEGVYRPVRSILYAIDYQIFGQSPFGYHLQAILIHLVGTVLVYFIAAQLVQSLKWVPFVAALLFGLHPIHTETISYISSSMESIGLVFYLAAIWAYLKKKSVWYWGSVGLAGLAFFSTEMALSLPLVIILVDLLLSKTRALKYTPYFALSGIYVGIRFFLVGAVERGPYLADSVYLTFLTMTKVFVKYLSLLIMPINLANNHTISPGIEAFVYRDYRTAAISAQSILDPAILVALLVLGVLVGLGVLLISHPSLRFVGFGILWFFITLLPVSEIVPQGSIMNEKFLYLPSFGFCFVAAWLICEWYANLKRINILLGVFIVVILGLYGLKTYTRNMDWHDNIRLWSKDVAIYPKENAYAYFQLGNAYSEVGELDLAVSNYGKSFEINSNFVVALGSIAKTYNNAGKVDLAIDFYEQSLLVNPLFWEAHNNLAEIYIKRGELDLARAEYEKILKILPNFVPKVNED